MRRNKKNKILNITSCQVKHMLNHSSSWHIGQIIKEFEGNQVKSGGYGNNLRNFKIIIIMMIF